MVILGVECTAHTFGIGIVTDKGEILASEKDSYTSADKGMIPHEIAEHHKAVAEKVLAATLEKAKILWKDISFIAYSAGPGLDPALWGGYKKVKEWGKKHNKKIIGVNHCSAHLSIGKLWNKLQDPCYLYVSGVNTQLIVEEGGKYHIVGETLDIGLGNMLDKLARILGLGFPGGPKIEELAKRGSYIELPYVVKGMDVSFSGILTKVEQIWKKNISHKEFLEKEGKKIEVPYIPPEEKQIIKIIKRFHKSLEKPISKEDLCFSVQETCFAMLTEVAERAMAHTEKKELVLVGGVGTNKRFGEMLDIMCQERKAKFYNVPMNLATDNGAMIAWEGYVRREQYGDLEVKPHWRIDEV